MFYTTSAIVFWICVALLGYVYFGYPLLVYAVSRLFPKKVHRSNIEPSVTVLITAFNEEKAIRRKLDNTLDIDYPAEKLEILVASDGSTDRTDEIVKEYAGRGVKLFRQDGRVGKTETQNRAIAEAAGEIVLFSDATTEYTQDVLERILPAFADDSVGCVAGRLEYVNNDDSNVGKGTQGYWNYETFLRSAESRACSLIGASGCMYAVRRSAYREMYPEACSDFLICTVLYRNDLRSVFEPSAVCFEETNQNTDDEMRMRIRVISQTLADLVRNADMLNPFKSGFYAIELISHKALRYAVPLMLAGMFISSVVLAASSPFFFVASVLQAAFYLSALVGSILERLDIRITLLVVPLYFVLANLASVIAFYRFIRGERYAAWEPIREVRS
ncbi:MAG: glycosyltransferase family 2 protein [Acidobacteria bacterium]|nr:glycosyltransferase family 2 protein [Acidobacteriota bacterium]MCO5332809.1 glycosyltransferase family 2 protein [Pyrinomonadaceae bacterium]